MNTLATNHSASPSANGWEFQYSAAICMMARNLPNVKELSVEGKEDIILRRKDNSIRYGQAKSSLKADAIQKTDHLPTIKKALNSLADNDKANPSERLYVLFNFKNHLVIWIRGVLR